VNLSEQDYEEYLKLLWTPAYFNDGGDGGYDLIYAFEFGYPFAFKDQWDYNPANSGIESTKTGYLNTCDSYPGTCSDSAPEAPGVCVAGLALCALLSSPFCRQHAVQSIVAASHSASSHRLERNRQPHAHLSGHGITGDHGLYDSGRL